MRIALACDWFLPRLGGIELQLRDLAVALRARGHDITVVTTTPGPSSMVGIQVERLRSLRLPGNDVPVSPALHGRIASVIESGRFDVVHAHASVISPVCYAAATIAADRGIPSVITFHSMLHLTARLLGATENVLHWSTGRVLLSAVSSVVATQAARWLPQPDVAVLPNGVDLSFWRTSAPRVRRGDEVVFATAMRLTRKKRPRDLIMAFAKAVQFVAGTPGLKLRIAGDGPARHELQRLVVELRLTDRVTFEGSLTRDALRELYTASDIFVLPSERESFGIAALEACASGLPVVARMESGVRDFVRHGVNGLLANDVVALSDAMARLALDEPMRNYMAKQNRSHALGYDWKTVVEVHESAYAEAARLLLRQV